MGSMGWLGGFGLWGEVVRCSTYDYMTGEMTDEP